MADLASEMDKFVNPYTFVPLDGHTTVHRGVPTGHDPMAALARGSVDAPAGQSPQPPRSPADTRYCGCFTVTWHTETPMLLPREAQSEGWITGKTGGVAAGTVASQSAPSAIRIPGSSVKGAIRCVHEAMFNGCLRIFDDTFRPTYRDALEPGLLTGWRLGVVVGANDGLPTRVLLADEAAVWVNAIALRNRYPGVDLPTTGDLLTYQDQPSQAPIGRWEIDTFAHAVGHLRPNQQQATDEDWWCKPAQQSRAVLLVTDTAARPRWRTVGGDRRRARAFWATARLTDEVCHVTDAAVEEFRTACAGSRDIQQADANERDRFRTRNVEAKVKWWSALEDVGGRPPDQRDMAQRLKASGYLHPGAVVWVWVNQTTRKVTGIKLAVAWRSLVDEDQGIARRVPSNRLGCTDPRDLCLSCATFGMVDATGSHAGHGEHAAYAGHVRFGNLTGDAVCRTVQLAPMGAPSPGSAGMYLSNRSLPDDRDRGDKPSQWGSAVDQEVPAGPRGIRGRKLYWHADPDAQAAAWAAALRRPAPPSAAPDAVPPRYQAREHHTRRTGMGAETRTLVPAGTQLSQRVTFDGLDRAALVALAAAIDPAAILGLVTGKAADIAHHLGGGKSFGLGTTTARITAAAIWTDGARYTGAAPQAAGTYAPTAADLALLGQRCGASVRLAIGRTGMVLARSALGLDANLVWYPPQGQWSDIGREEFDQSYEFFTQNTGERLANRDRDFHTLPMLSPASQRLPNARGGHRAQRAAGPPGAQGQHAYGQAGRNPAGGGQYPRNPGGGRR